MERSGASVLPSSFIKYLSSFCQFLFSVCSVSFFARERVSSAADLVPGCGWIPSGLRAWPARSVKGIGELGGRCPKPEAEDGAAHRMKGVTRHPRMGAAQSNLWLPYGYR